MSTALPVSIQGILQPKGFPSLPAGWVFECETQPSKDGQIDLFVSTFRREKFHPGTGHRVLLIAHGIGEHSGRYLHFPHYLADSVDWVVAADHRGHGRSSGLRGHVGHFHEYGDDFAATIRHLDEKLKKLFGRSEIHVLGHSMGSLILLDALLRNPKLPIVSATASSPLLALRMKVPTAKKWGAHALAKVWGHLQMDSELNVDHLSHDREVIQTYTKDRLVHSKITPLLYLSMQALMSEMIELGKSGGAFPYPLLEIVPMDDPILDPEAALAFFKGIRQDDKLLKSYPGFLHESFNEIGKEKVFEDLKAWIKLHSREN